MNEIYLAYLLCGFLGGADVEARQHFETPEGRHHVRVDCETPTHVIEIALDNTASARDSVHQAVFSSVLTDKIPMVIIVDRDGVEDRYEHEVRIVAAELGVSYGVCNKDFIVRWAATAPFRNLGDDKEIDDLPQNANYVRYCNLGQNFRILFAY